jgi:predicted oxidoreductase
MLAKLARDSSNKTTPRLILGTMRLLEVDRSKEQWVDFFEQISSIGIDTLHSSLEYDSFGLLCEALGVLALVRPDIQFRHVVKLAEPSFDDGAFSANRLIEKIDHYKKCLGTDIVHDIQWMWRMDLKDDPKRLKHAENSFDEMAKAVAELKSSSQIERFFCFPYSPEFAQLSLKSDAVDGLVVYRNTREIEYDDAINACADAGKSTMIIRPFAAGALIDGSSTTISELIKFALDERNIEGAIFSSNNIAHIREISRAMSAA